jgi:virginiamycin B lyase
MKVKYIKKILPFGLIILILLYLSFLSTSSIFIRNYHQIAMALPTQEKHDDAFETFQKGFCGLNAKPNFTGYITEYVLPQDCEMPLGIAVDEEDEDDARKVWYVSTNKGLLGSYSIEEDKFNQDGIPEWKSRENPRDFSQVWDLKIDEKDGNVWFPDEKQNAIWRYIKSSNIFEKYLVPGESKDFGTTYPVFIEFDPNDHNIFYFVGMFSPSLWIAKIDKLKNGTSEGIREIPIPINAFRGIDPVYVTTGSIAFDDNEDAVWVSMMIYGYKGQIFRYDLDTESFDIFDLPKDLSSPWGLSVDNDGNLWVTNAGTSIFYKFDPPDDSGKNAHIEKFVTSTASPRIFGKSAENNTERDFQSGYYTLPSLIKKSEERDIWFNEQHGNKISKFDPSDRKLIEYWIPTQNRLWGICSNKDNSNGSNNNNNTCGIANVLQFSIAQNDNNNDEQIWFTEWSENKIGKLEADNKNLPFSIAVFESDKELTVERGEREKIKLRVKTSESPSSPIGNIRMIASGTFTSTGDLGNSTGYFTEQSISMNAEEEQDISFIFIPSIDLKPRDYTLMIGAENGSVSYLRAIKVTIT